MSETCETCRFWSDGDCYRMPPTVTIVVTQRQFSVNMHGNLKSWDETVDRATARPAVAADNWCGEYRAAGVKVEMIDQ